MRSHRDFLKVLRKTDSILGVMVSRSLDDFARLHSSIRRESILPGGKLAEVLESDGGAGMAGLQSWWEFGRLMSPHKRRILLKMIALRAIIGKRKLASLYTWETAIEEAFVAFQEECSGLIKFPMKWTEAFLPSYIRQLSSLQKNFKARIKLWERDFEKNLFRRPSGEDKEERKDWYLQYKSLKNMVENLEAGDPPRGLPGDWRVRSERIVHEFETSVRLAVLPCSSKTVEKVTTLTHDLKTVIREWESAWEQSFGEAISTENKKRREGKLYRIYSNMKKLEGSVLEFRRRAEELGKQSDKVFLVSVYSREVLEGDGEVAADAAKLGDAWKSLINDWVAEFLNRSGRGNDSGMTSDEKNVAKEWYWLYKKSREKAKEVNGFKTDIKKLYKESKGLLKRGRKSTKNEDSNGEDHMINSNSVNRSAVLKLKTKWKSHIHSWEKAFRKSEGRDPVMEDKKRIQRWYEMYRNLSDLDVALEKEMLKLMVGTEDE